MTMIGQYLLAAICLSISCTSAGLSTGNNASILIQKDANGRTLQSDLEDKTLPEDFDWEAYLSYHPDIFNSGVATEDAAKAHYLQEGIVGGLLYHRINVILRYTACTGLINQVYSHISAISLGIMLGAELVLPPAAVRDSFEHYFSVFKDRNEVLWSPAPLSDLLDVDEITKYWGEKGVAMHQAEFLEPFPDLTQPYTAFVPYPSSKVAPDCIVQLHNIYASVKDMDELIQEVRQIVVEVAEFAEGKTPGRVVNSVVLDLPCTFFMLKTASNRRLMSSVAKSLTWAPKVQELADKVTNKIKVNSQGRLFNSLHLRIEKDARDWVRTMGGAEAIWEVYMSTMKDTQFSAKEDIYIASGLLSYGAKEELDFKIQDLKDKGLCSSAHYKELYLSQSELEGLNSEQKALVDFLVLKEGYNFVGFGTSTFSFYIKELRQLNGIPRIRSQLVDASAIGTDDLFAEAAILS